MKWRSTCLHLVVQLNQNQDQSNGPHSTNERNCGHECVGSYPQHHARTIYENRIELDWPDEGGFQRNGGQHACIWSNRPRNKTSQTAAISPMRGIVFMSAWSRHPSIMLERSTKTELRMIGSMRVVSNEMAVDMLAFGGPIEPESRPVKWPPFHQ